TARDFAGEPQSAPEPAASGVDETPKAQVPADSAAPEPAAPESLDPEVPPIPSTAEEPTAVAADPVAELAESTATGSFPDVPPDAASADPELGEAPIAGREVPEDEKKAARARDREARDEIRRIVDALMADYAAVDRGIDIREVAGGFRMATRAEYHDAVRAFVKTLKPPMKLSLQALETLAVIAYKQPVTAPEIGEIRGVDSAGVLGSLVARKLVTTAGRKQVIGRPILYKTTKEFLLRFGLKDISELPSLEEFEKMANELAESEEEAAAIAPSEEELPFTPEEAEADVPAPAENKPATEGDPVAEANIAAEPAPTSEHDASADGEESQP
ncbi:MAG TPA: SMC-Scp complex subunit ScpB, partial [Acidobacteriaceae bacterium]|nr:SMC-Scp complex subunit ScpB [Acidobacteriaceae bacterium]